MNENQNEIKKQENLLGEELSRSQLTVPGGMIFSSPQEDSQLGMTRNEPNHYQYNQLCPLIL
jgi:hypothetical protein